MAAVTDGPPPSGDGEAEMADDGEEVEKLASEEAAVIAKRVALGLGYTTVHAVKHVAEGAYNRVWLVTLGLVSGWHSPKV